MNNRGVSLLLVILMIMPSLTAFPTFDAKAGSTGMPVELSGTDASFLGEVKGDYAGQSVAYVGDVNGDGYGDLLVGAPWNNQVAVYSGKAYLIFGGPSGWKMGTNLSKANASFVGERVNSHFGDSVSGGCDLNGDGLMDMVISASSNTEQANSYGEAYVIFGRTSGWAKDMPINSVANGSFRGEVNINSYTSSMKTACSKDLNGDGLGDVIVSDAWFNVTAGKTYVFFGKKAGWAMDSDLGSADASFIGEHPGDLSGYGLAALGDINGDGLGDLLLGAPSNIEGGGINGDTQTEAGQIYLVLGKTSGWKINTSLSSVDASFIGQVNDHAGMYVSALGDVNGDGLDDFIAGISSFSGHYQYEGAAYLFFGKKSYWSMDSQLIGSADATFVGTKKYEELGYEVGRAGDFNGDGFDDILIGSYQQSPEVYLFFGKANNWSMNLNVTNADLYFNGSSYISAMDGGKLNGDKYSDVILGNSYDQAGGLKSGQTFVTFGYDPKEAHSLLSLAAFADQGCSIPLTNVSKYQPFFVKATTSDGDPVHPDFVMVNISNDHSKPGGFETRLYETGNNTKVFVGAIRTDDDTDISNRWIAANPGDHVIITAKMDPSKTVGVLVGGLTLLPAKTHDTLPEDAKYKVHFLAENGTKVDMSLQTNATWLSLNDTTGNLTGAANNTQLGTYWVKMMASDGYGNLALVSYNIKVINTPPMILTTSITSVLQDQNYYVDYNSSDDGQGIITWHLQTNATWLNLDIQSGVLSGRPNNSEVGHYYVRVGVDDGNGGWSWANFTLFVIDVEDPPVITTKDVTVATEDKLYTVKYNATDVDFGDNKFSWAVSGNETWLHIDSHTGLLYGTPTNTDIGLCYVNVTVRDRALLEDHHNFTLKVLNVPPKILTKDVTTATQDVPYHVHYSSDDDGQGKITWGLSTNATWLKMNVSNGDLSGVPKNADVGVYLVKVTVNDGNGGSASTSFKLTVLNVNDPPVISSAPVLNATVDKAYSYHVKATDADKGSVLNFSLETAPHGMSIDNKSGNITWTPADGQEGRISVSVRVSDGTTFVLQNFTISVGPHLVVSITRPVEGQKVSGKFRVFGIAKGPSDVTVEVNVDGSGWKSAQGGNFWNYTVDTTNMKDGAHTLQVRSSWNGRTSAVCSVSFTVQKAQGIGLAATLMIGAVLALIVIVVAVVLVIVLRRRPKTKKE